MQITCTHTQAYIIRYGQVNTGLNNKKTRNEAKAANRT